MQLRQEIRLRQEQILQPQQILRSELIQLPQLLLEARFQQEFEQNPLLEIIEEDERRSEDEDDRMENAAVQEAESESEEREQREAEREGSEVDWEGLLNDEEEQREYRSHRAITEPIEIPQPDKRSLTDNLREQLTLDRLTEKQIIIGEYIIGSLNSRGYLDATLEQIAELTEATVEEVEEVLVRIQHYDPPGIAARDLRECLLVQLEVRGEEDSLPYRILHDHFDNFVNRRYEIIAQALGVTPREVQQAYDSIARLNPYPGEGVIDEKLNYVIPDLVVEEIGGEFVVSLNDGNIPSFYINEELKKLILSKKDSDKKAREFAIQKAESARWFINAIHQRRTTMLRTMRAIVDRQHKWFETGRDTDLKPMILNDIAEDIGMDISTISRVTRDKYVQTPYGVRELKFFFNDRMETSSGEEVATRIIKAKLKEIIDGEDKAKPLSDQQIADLLAREGYPIARRTVQKYREQLGIPVKRLRRQVVG